MSNLSSSIVLFITDTGQGIELSRKEYGTLKKTFVTIITRLVPYKFRIGQYILNEIFGLDQATPSIKMGNHPRHATCSYNINFHMYFLTLNNLSSLIEIQIEKKRRNDLLSFRLSEASYQLLEYLHLFC